MVLDQRSLGRMAVAVAAVVGQTEVEGSFSLVDDSRRHHFGEQKETLGHSGVGLAMVELAAEVGRIGVRRQEVPDQTDHH